MVENVALFLLLIIVLIIILIKLIVISLQIYDGIFEYYYIVKINNLHLKLKKLSV